MARSKEKVSATAGRRLSLAREYLGMTAESLLGWDRWSYVHSQKGIPDSRVPIISNITTLSRWETKGVPLRRVKHVADAFGMDPAHFTDENLSDETFLGILKKRQSHACVDLRPQQVKDFERLLSELYGLDGCAELLAAEGFDQAFLLDYACEQLNPESYRLLCVETYLKGDVSEEGLHRLSEMGKSYRAKATEHAIALFKEDPQSLVGLVSERVMKSWVHNGRTNIIPMADYMINEAKILDVSVFDNVTAYLKTTNKYKIVDIIIKNDAPGRLDRINEHKEPTYWKIRDAITDYVIRLHENDAYADETEARKGKDLLQWALNEANWDMLKKSVVDRREYCQGRLTEM
ncbi:MAG: hypothetical protein AB7D07_10370 [Desulfovibrionaceae bacterium]